MLPTSNLHQTMETLKFPIPIPLELSNHHSPLLHHHSTAARLNSLHLLRFTPSLLSPPRYFAPLRSFSIADHDHHHNHHDNDHEHHRHNHHHHHDGDYAKLTETQRAFIKFAKAVRWIDLTDLLREHLHLCLCSAALFLTAAACPYVVPKLVMKSL